MRKYIIPVLFLLLCSININAKDKWPDGTAVSEWFAKTSCVDVNALGKQYVITDYGVKQDSTLLQTVQIQNYCCPVKIMKRFKNNISPDSRYVWYTY